LSNKLSIGHERTSEGHGDAADATVRSVFYASQDYSVDELGADFSEPVRDDTEEDYVLSIKNL
jgi:hypothetical protein